MFVSRGPECASLGCHSGKVSLNKPLEHKPIRSIWDEAVFCIFRMILLGNFCLICEETQTPLLSFPRSLIQGVRLWNSSGWGGQDGAAEPVGIAAASRRYKRLGAVLSSAIPPICTSGGIVLRGTWQFLPLKWGAVPASVLRGERPSTSTKWSLSLLCEFDSSVAGGKMRK